LSNVVQYDSQPRDASGKYRTAAAKADLHCVFRLSDLLRDRTNRMTPSIAQMEDLLMRRVARGCEDPVAVIEYPHGVDLPLDREVPTRNDLLEWPNGSTRIACHSEPVSNAAE
jgi:hypothetical protein